MGIFNKPPKARLQDQIAFILGNSGVPAPEVDRCMKWAFGPHVWNVPPFPTWADEWHKRHPTAFHINPSDKFVELIFVIGFYYEMEKKKSAIGKQNFKSN